MRVPLRHAHVTPRTSRLNSYDVDVMEHARIKHAREVVDRFFIANWEKHKSNMFRTHNLLLLCVLESIFQVTNNQKVFSFKNSIDEPIVPSSLFSILFPPTSHHIRIK